MDHHDTDSWAAPPHGPYRGCPPDQGYCSEPQAHSSLDCYPRYAEIEYEGTAVMTYEEWLLVP